MSAWAQRQNTSVKRCSFARTYGSPMRQAASSRVFATGRLGDQVVIQPLHSNSTSIGDGGFFTHRDFSSEVNPPDCGPNECG